MNAYRTSGVLEISMIFVLSRDVVVYGVSILLGFNLDVLRGVGPLGV